MLNKCMRCSRQRGAYLLEVLVAIVVLSVGLLGLLGLMLGGLKISTSNTALTIATDEVARMADMIRGNANEASLGDYYNMTYSGGTSSADLNRLKTENSACYTSSGCTPSQTVNTNMAVWYSRLDALLPDPDGSAIKLSGVGPGASLPANNNDDGSWSFTSGDANLPLVIRVCWNETGRVEALSSTRCVYTHL